MLSPKSTLKTCILQEMHSSPVAGHYHFKKTYTRAQRSFFWMNMKNKILTFVFKCDIRQHKKGQVIKLLGTLQPFPLPYSVWIDLSMDFIIGLRNSGNKLVINGGC